MSKKSKSKPRESDRRPLIAFRVSPDIAELLEEHFSRLMRRNPGVLFTKTSAITGLITRGAQAFREDDEREEEDESE